MRRPSRHGPPRRSALLRQVRSQHPTAFEFNAAFLRALAAAHDGEPGPDGSRAPRAPFDADSEAARASPSPPPKAWAHLLSPELAPLYVADDFEAGAAGVLTLDCRVSTVRLRPGGGELARPREGSWRDLYRMCLYRPGYPPAKRLAETEVTTTEALPEEVAMAEALPVRA